MSPSQVLERSYDAFKALLTGGTYRPGQRLDAPGIARDLDVSVTPVREVLARLTGEGLVQAIAGGGFFVPLLTEDDLRDLYGLTLYLLLLAMRHLGPRLGEAMRQLPAEDTATATAALFERLSRLSGNREVTATMSRLNDRLHALRRIERQVLPQSDEELATLEAALDRGDATALGRGIRTYHARRLKRVPDLVRLHRESGSPS